MLKEPKIYILSIIAAFTLLITSFLTGNTPSYPPYEIKINEVVLLDSSLIVKQDESTIIPVQYMGKINFDSFETSERKEKFIQFMLPSIVIVREQLLDKLHHVGYIESRIKREKPISPEDSVFLANLKQQYKAETIKDLKIRLYPQPISLVLAQAILESGWGTSRIFRKGNNPFGIMSFSSDDSRLINLLPDNEVDIYMRTYNHVTEAVEHYFMLTSKVSSYRKFRQKRWEGASSFELIDYLKSYHETEDYSQMAKSIIKTNDLTKYDLATIDPRYVKSKSLLSLLMKN